MLVEVDEDWTNTVTKTPIINPAKGLLNTGLLNNSLADRPYIKKFQNNLV